MYSTSYNNNVYDSKPLNYHVDYSFLSKIADKRGQESEMAYRYLDNLKNKALNIRFLNQTADAKVQEYNTEIDNFFKDKDLSKVDLADYKTSNSYAKIFDKIASDTALTKSYQVDKQIQSTMQTWNDAAKNPNKTGYNVANHNVWLNEHLQPYIGEKDLTKLPTFNAGNYDPEYDYQKELTNLKGQVHFDGNKFELNNGQGIKETIDVQAVTAEKLHSFFKGALSGKAINQMVTEAKSGFYNHYNSIPESQQHQVALDLYEKDKETNLGIQKQYTSKIAELEGKIKTASPQDQVILNQQKEQYQQAANQYDFKASPKDYTSLSKTGLANRYAGNQVESKLSKLAQGMAYQIKKVTSSLDEPYWKRQNFNFEMNKELYDRNRDVVKDKHWQQEFDLKQTKELNDHNEALMKKGGKDAADLQSKSNGYFSGYVEGDLKSGVTTVNDINKDLGQLDIALKYKDPETLTAENVKAMIENNDGSPISNTVRTHAMQLGYSGSVTNEMLGYIKGQLKNSLEHGDLSNYFNDLKVKQRHLSGIKDKTWNNVIQEHLPQLVGKSNEEIQRFFTHNPSLAATIKTYWNDELTSNMTSIRGTSVVVDLTKDKEFQFRNADMVASAVNSNPQILGQLGVPQGKAITRDMIESAIYSPLTGKMKVTFAQNAVRGDNSGLAKQMGSINSAVVEVDVPNTIRKQFGVDINPKEEVFEQSGVIDGNYKGATYKISKDYNNNGYKHFVLTYKDKNGQTQTLNSTGSYVDGQYVQPQPSNASVVEIEQYLKNFIDSKK